MTAPALVTAARPISLTREGAVFRLSFRYDRDLVSKARTLPDAEFDGSTKTWTVAACTQSVQALRGMFYQGLTDVPVDSLVGENETLPTPAPATLRAGSIRRPFVVHLLVHGDDDVYSRFKSIPGANWDKKPGQRGMLSFPPAAAMALCDLLDRGVLDDPSGLLTPTGVLVGYDTRSGGFRVRGDDRAAAAFARNFPHRDVVSAWQERQLDASFSDEWSAEIYRGEIARVGAGLQPDGLLIDLFTYQRQTVAIAVERGGLAVFDEPGLGKTATGIATGLEFLNRSVVPRVVIVVPAAVRTQWKNEIVKFTGCDPADIVVCKGTPKQRAAAYAAAADARWFIVHYDVLNRDKADLKALFRGAFVIADEAHRLKNFASTRTVAAKELARGAARRMALTGTPSERGPDEWFEVLGSFAVPGCLGSPEDFNSRYRFKGRFGGYEGARNLPELRERSRPFYVRSTKREVAKHLPPLVVQTTILDPDAAYAAALRRAHREAANEIREAALAQAANRRAGGGLDDDAIDAVGAGAEMTAIGMLRLLCSSPRLVAESTSAAAQVLKDAGIVPEEDGPKIDELRTIGAELLAAQQQRKDRMVAEGVEVATADMVRAEKVVIFSFSKRMANLIAQRYAEDGIPHVLFTGDTSSDDRDVAVERFMDPTADVVAFIATDAAGEGINLPAASLLINADLAWTASKMWQRANRIHRLNGTADSYRVLNLTLASTLEAGVQQLLNHRADLADALFGETGGRSKTTGVRTAAPGAGARGRDRSVYEEAMDLYLAEHDAKEPARRSRKKAPSATTPTPPAAQASAGSTASGRPGDAGASAAGTARRTARRPRAVAGAMQLPLLGLDLDPVEQVSRTAGRPPTAGGRAAKDRARGSVPAPQQFDDVPWPTEPPPEDY